jgi:hypothetical protein
MLGVEITLRILAVLSLSLKGVPDRYSWYQSHGFFSDYLCDLEKDLGKLSLIIGPLFEERDVSWVISGPTKES